MSTMPQIPVTVRIQILRIFDCLASLVSVGGEPARNVTAEFSHVDLQVL